MVLTASRYLGLRAWGLGLGLSGFGFGIWGLRFRVSTLWASAVDSEFWLLALGGGGSFGVLGGSDMKKSTGGFPVSEGASRILESWPLIHGGAFEV